MTPWTQESAAAKLRAAGLPEPFGSRQLCGAMLRMGGHWSEGQGLLAALRKFGLVTRRPVRLSNTGRVVCYEYRSVDQVAEAARRLLEAAEARALLRIDAAPVTTFEQAVADLLRGIANPPMPADWNDVPAEFRQEVERRRAAGESAGPGWGMW